MADTQAASQPLAADDIQNSIRALVHERAELRERLFGPRPGAPMGAVQRMLGRSLDTRRGSKRAAPEIGGMGSGDLKPIGPPADADGSGRNAEASSSAAGVSHTATAAPERIRPEFVVEKRPRVESDAPTARRTRNMFGSLLGHLKKARTRLEQEKDTRQAELQKTVEEQVDLKLSLERRNLAELRRRELRERKTKDAKRMRELQRELAVKETELLRVNLENHYESMQNFIRTEAQPMIFWLPAVHNDVTRQLQEETKMQIQRKLISLREKFAAPAEVQFDDRHLARFLDEDGSSGSPSNNHAAGPDGTTLTFHGADGHTRSADSTPDKSGDRNRGKASEAAPGKSQPAAGCDERTVTERVTQIHPDLMDDDDDYDHSGLSPVPQQQPQRQHPSTAAEISPQRIVVASNDKVHEDVSGDGGAVGDRTGNAAGAGDEEETKSIESKVDNSNNGGGVVVDGVGYSTDSGEGGDNTINNADQHDGA